MIGTHDNMVNQINFEQLPGADEMAGAFDIASELVRWGWDGCASSQWRMRWP